MVEELKKKEDQECTFQPKTLPRGSPRTCKRSPDPSGESKWSQNWEQRMRSQRLKQVEAQAYAEVTLKPKISRFAQAWSQKQNEALGDGEAPVSVFERLYATMQKARSVRDMNEIAQEDSTADEAAGRASGMQAEGLLSSGCGSAQQLNGPPRPQQPRRIPTSELLYSDALDRRERLRAMSDQLQSRADEISREKRQVLGRSRRYYWQMLERQIKAAFDGATSGDPLLKQSALEDFLLRFGCIRARNQRTDAQAALEEESSRLQAALWRHLDPHKTGQTDLLTVTVFFHVLMGAVDDAARASQSLYPGTAPGSSCVGETSQESPTTPHSPSSPRGTRPPRSPSPGSPIAGTADDAAALAAITEEEAVIGEEGQKVGADTAAGGALSPLQGVLPSAADDDEGRRIVDLLLRFDPVRLRAEFQTMYIMRMCNRSAGKQFEAAFVGEKPEEQVVSPEIDSQSRIMAARLVERCKGESEKTISSHADLMAWRHSQSEAKKEEARSQAKSKEVSGCTFRPRTSPRPHDLQVDLNTPKGATRAQVLYARAVADRERRECKVMEETKARSNAEVRDCTFRPDTAKSERSYHRTHESAPAAVPRGFYETRQRLRNASEVERQKRKQREDRLAKPAPAVNHGACGVAGANTSTTAPIASVGRLGDFSHASTAGSPLPSLAEDPIMEHRRSMSPKTAWGPPGSGLRTANRSRSTGGHGHSPRGLSPRGSSPRGLSPRGEVGQEQHRIHGTAGTRTHSQPGVASPEKFLGAPEAAASSNSADAGGITGKGFATHAAIEGADIGGGVAAESGSTGVGAAAVPIAAAQEEGLPPPLLYVDVNIAPGQPPERIVLREGQSVNEVAAEFAARHVLTPVLAQRLHALLKEVLQRQEQHLLQQHLR